MEQKQIAKTLASFAPAYQNAILKIDQNENWKKQFENDPEANYIALQFFLEHFAYERDVKVEAYPVIAKQTIEEVFNRKLETVNCEQAIKAWEIYRNIADSKGINTNLNPMNKDKGVLTVMTEQSVPNIANHVKTLLGQKETKKAYDFIDRIRGIGTKIASFYLRDIVYLAPGLEENQIGEDQFYLQPLDIRLIQALSIIKGERIKINLKNNKERQDAQKMIVDLCKEAGCSPIEFNQGAWFAGSQIARGDFNKFKKIALGEAESKEIVKDYVKKQRHYISEIEKALDRN